ncbi:MAG: type IV pilin protein [Thermodesulfobacteriota bacterium]
MERLRRKNKGFTLIEIVLVIVILGILAAVAIPRFIRLRADAEQAVGDGVSGAMSGGISMLHAQYLIRNTDYNATSVVSRIDIGGGLVTIAVDGLGGAGEGETATLMATLTNDRTFTWLYTHRVGEEAGQLRRYY